MATRNRESQEPDDDDESIFHTLRADGSHPPADRNTFRWCRVSSIPRVVPATTRSLAELEERQISRLPCQAVDFYADRLLPLGWNPVLKTILQGTRQGHGNDNDNDDDDATTNSGLTRLRNYENTLVRHVYSFLWNPYAGRVRLTLPADLVGNGYDTWLMKFVAGRSEHGSQDNPGYGHIKEEDVSLTSLNNAQNGFVSFCRVANDIDFPSPRGINVNMMPFILGDKDSLPDDLQPYYQMIDICPFYGEEKGKVAYLTVHESHVEEHATQRRPGLHIESPGVFPDPPVQVQENEIPPCSFSPGVEHPWGMGIWYGPDRYEGGIYFCSNMDDTSQVWDALVDRTVPGIVDRHGGCDHLRYIIGPGTKLRAGDLVWMTDCTPHEALPQPQAGTRQFFRLVMPYISHWYADHSTPNPKVSLPDSITVIHGNKFGEQDTGVAAQKTQSD